jgi:hypothetical protein
MPQQRITIQPLTEISSDEVTGLRIIFGTFWLECFLKPPPEGLRRRLIVEGRYRTTAIDFHGRARDARIILTWPQQGGTVQRLGFEIAGRPV